MRCSLSRAAALQKRALSGPGSDRPTWLANAHHKLDEAVCTSYAHTTGAPAWRPDMTDEQILEGLLALNLARAGNG